MALFIQKPIFWNTKNYQGPSGVRATSGFPSDTGFGHEEWNNSKRLLRPSDDGDVRFFHTEPVRVKDLEKNAGQIFVFMTASHDGIQEFVGIAALATGIFGDEFQQQRINIANELGLNDFQEAVWNLPIVKEKYEDKGNSPRRAFLRDWRRDLSWIPNWICPDTHFWWFDKPIAISSEAVRKTKRWLTMFNSYTKLSSQNAIQIMDLIPDASRDPKWDVIRDAIIKFKDSNVDLDLPLPLDEKDAVRDIVTKAMWTAVRIGQGTYRQKLLRFWDEKCAVTGLDCKEALRASHMKPWSESNNREKLDKYNGLILSSNLDSLFDKGLISFKDDGTMKVSSVLSENTKALLGLPMSINKPLHPESLPYLKYHRKNKFQR